MLDVAGLALAPAERELLAHPSVGGVILFARNYESPAQVKALTAEIAAIRTPAPNTTLTKGNENPHALVPQREEQHDNQEDQEER